MRKLAVIAGLLFGGMASQLGAACSDADLHATYSFVASGTLGSSAFAATGLGIYDGNGVVSSVIQISLGGTLTPLLNWTGTYKVDPTNCTFTKTINIDTIGAVSFFVTAADAFKRPSIYRNQRRRYHRWNR